MIKLYGFNELNEKAQKNAIMDRCKKLNNGLSCFTSDIIDFVFDTLEDYIYDELATELLIYEKNLEKIKVNQDKIELKFKFNREDVKYLFPPTREFRDAVESEFIFYSEVENRLCLNFDREYESMRNEMLLTTIKALVDYHNSNIEMLEELANKHANNYYKTVLMDVGRIETMLKIKEEFLYDEEGKLIATTC